MKLGIWLKILVVKSTMRLVIQGIKKIKTTTISKILGTKERVISFICVVAWKMLMVRPATRPARSIGKEIKRVILKVCTPKDTKALSILPNHSHKLSTKYYKKA